MIKYIRFHYFVHLVIIVFSVQPPSAHGFGMHGSGMFTPNPPWTLHNGLKQVMPYLVKVLGQDEGAGLGLAYRENNPP